MAVLCFVSMTVKAQYTFIYEDTIGMYPYFYYGDFPKTGIYHPDSTPCALYADGQIAGYGTTISPWPDEYALKMHTDDTLRVIGIACCYLYCFDTVRVSIYDSAMNRMTYAKFYQSTMVQAICTDTQYHSLHVRGCQSNTPHYNNRNRWETFWFTIFDGKWGEPVKVVGDFYIGITREYTPMMDMGVLQCFWHEGHEAPWYFPGSDYRLRYNGEWDTLEHTERSLPSLFPIIDPPCVSIDSVTVEADSAGCVTVRWDSLPMQTHWMVSFGPEGTAAGEGETDTVSERQWRRCGLEPGDSYTVSVRSRCNLLYRQEWSPWSGVWTVTAGSNPNPVDPDPEDPPEGISEVEATGFTLRPNPAREEVTLEGGAWMAGGVLTVTDMRGTEVVRRKVESGRLTLDVSRLPKGAYTVSVTTGEGTAARRLVVQ